jgi:hypothetical protein
MSTTRANRDSIASEVEGQIRQLLADFSERPTAVPAIAERIGWRRSMTVVRERVRQLHHIGRRRS